MLIAIHSNGALPTISTERGSKDACLWIDLAEGQSIQLSQLEAAHIIAELQAALDEIDARADRAAADAVGGVVTDPLFTVVAGA